MPTKTCIFCGGSPTNKEHIFPDWLNKLFPEVRVIGRRAFSRDEVIVSRSEWISNRIADMHSRSVCKICNQTWMSDIEVAAKSYILDMMNGNGLLLNPKAQQAVATWASLKAMVGRYANTPVFPVPTDWLAEMGANHRPPKTWHVLLARYSGDSQMCYYEGPDVVSGRKGEGRLERSLVHPDDEAVAMSLIVNQLAVKVLGFRRSLRPVMRDGRKSLPGFVIVWPRNIVPVAWPPAVSFGDDTREVFRSAFIG